MTTLHEPMPVTTEFGTTCEEDLIPETHCFSFMCIGLPFKKQVGLEYRALLKEDCREEKYCIDQGRYQRAKLLRWKVRKPVFSYDSRSYALNFDEGVEHGTTIYGVGSACAATNET